MSETPVWHVIDSVTLHEALQRAIDSGNAELTYLELYANGDSGDVSEKEPDLASLFWLRVGPSAVFTSDEIEAAMSDERRELTSIELPDGSYLVEEVDE